jgi:hypothetical protein
VSGVITTCLPVSSSVSARSKAPSPTAALLGDQGGQPARRDNLLPGVGVDAGPRIAQLTRAARTSPRRAELGRGVAQQDLLFVQQQFHGGLMRAG